MKRIVIVGGGFAGLWSAFSAIRLAREIGKTDQLSITLVNKDEYHGIRPRFYESDLTPTRIPLAPFLTPLGVHLTVGTVNAIDYQQQRVHCTHNQTLAYDRLILATGSQLYRPAIPGLAEHAFNVDTYQAAVSLQHHIASLPSQTGEGRFTIVVAGGSFTGIEAATDLMDRLKTIAPTGQARVIVIDRSKVASRFSPAMQAVILNAFSDLGIECLSGVQIKAIAKDHIELDSGERVATQTVVWTAGMQSSALTQQFGLALDAVGRLPVDRFLRIPSIDHCFAAGDVAAATTDGTHMALLSCQHAMPQGRFAGHNAVASLFDQPLLQYEQPVIVTCLDLGSWGAVYAQGWDQQVVSIKAPAKERKLFINHERIYPPAPEQGIEVLMEAARPVFKAMKF